MTVLMRIPFGHHLCLCAVNLAFALAMHAKHAPRVRPRVGVLDLDIFGPSIPKLMALEDADEPALTSGVSPYALHTKRCYWRR